LLLLLMMIQSNLQTETLFFYKRGPVRTLPSGKSGLRVLQHPDHPLPATFSESLPHNLSLNRQEMLIPSKCWKQSFNGI